MTEYWQQAGKENTEATCALAIKWAAEKGIKHIVVASNTGYTARYLVGKIPGLTVVTHEVGFREPGDDEMSRDERDYLAAQGAKVVTATHLFGGVDRAASTKFGGVYTGGLIAHTLRTFGQGTKVCLEIASMALDAGAIPWGEDVIAIGGTARGADTAMVIRPAHAKEFFSTQVREVICKPLNWEVR